MQTKDTCDHTWLGDQILNLINKHN